MHTNLLTDFRKLANNHRYITIGGLVDAARSEPCEAWLGVGKYVWDNTHGHRDDAAEIAGSWPGWPQCGCTCCGCDECATCTDDGGTPCCAACADYTTDDGGEVVCSRDERTEMVTVSCGAGNQTLSFVRLAPPEMPETDDSGEYCLYFATVGDDAHVVSRFGTRERAEQAVAAKDWPRPGDGTNYLCGFEVRQLVDGEWMPLGE